MAAIDLTKQITRRDGVAFTMDEIGEKPWTIKDVLLAIVDTPLQSDGELSAKDKRRLAEFGDRVYDANGSIELSDTDIEEAKDRALRIFPVPRMYDQIVKALA